MCRPLYVMLALIPNGAGCCIVQLVRLLWFFSPNRVMNEWMIVAMTKKFNLLVCTI